MKKILGILMATMMAVTLAGCSSNKHDYLKEAEETRSRAVTVTDQAYYVNDVRTAVRGFFELAIQLNNGIENSDDADKIISATKRFIENSNVYLTRIDRLDPPDDEKLFHKELLEWVDIAREYNNNLSEFCDSKNDENKVNAALSKINSSLDKLENKTKELANSRDWFKRAVEDYL